MLIKSSQTMLKEFGDVKIWDYIFGKDELGIAKAEINGRYPKEGFSVNKECSQIYFVISGEANINYCGEEYEISEGDSFFFEKGKKYYVETKGVLSLVIVNSPEFDPNQCVCVE